MPNILCPNAIVCPGTDDPITNYSSEAVDGVEFTATGWPIGDDSPICASRNCPTPGCQNPPCITGPPSLYTIQGCVFTCTAVTQELARLCAAQAAFICAHTDDHGSHPPFFFNHVQQCTIHCPDGEAFTWTVAPGTFVNLSQVLADNQAHQYACLQAHNNAICLSDIPGLCCIGDFCTATIVASTRLTPVTMEISSGSLPPGWSFVDLGNGSATIGGTGRAPGGDFTFTVKASSGNAEAFKTYTVTVWGIVEDMLPDGKVGHAYSQQLNGAGGTPGYVFSLYDGSFPAGISMNSSGLISGTPTDIEGEVVDIRITDSNGTGNSCIKTLTISITGPKFTNTPPAGTVCTAYSSQLTVECAPLTDCTATSTFALASGALPDGLALSAGGLISGTPTASGTFNFTVQATHGSDTNTSPTFSIVMTLAGLASAAKDLVWTTSETVDPDAGGTTVNTLAGNTILITATGGCVAGSIKTATRKIFSSIRNCSPSGYTLTMAVNFTVPAGAPCGVNPHAIADITIILGGNTYVYTLLTVSGTEQNNIAIPGSSGPIALECDCSCRGADTCNFTVSLTPASPP